MVMIAFMDMSALRMLVGNVLLGRSVNSCILALPVLELKCIIYDMLVY